ncbi:MAG TPA: MBL fold metallo-hydrolase [Candidatus Limnocylindrales bacterium]|nr:MBL fold metallo-hydrolase [Candidatus Limnocylindrales bacterium]
MELTFLGGARTVTGSRHLLDTGRARVLVDCGMFQGGPDETLRNRVPLGFDPSTVDAVVLTHAHLDHCGLLPLLVARGFRGRIICTAATAELARLVLLDSAKLQVEFAKRAGRRERRNPERAAEQDARDEEAFDELVELAVEGARAPGGPDPEDLLRAAPPVVEVDLDGPLYTEDEVNLTLSLLRPIPYDQEYEAAHGVHVTLLDAGHILGSALVRMRVTRPGGGRDTVVVFSGDLGRPGTPILRDPTPVPDADFVVCESTYGGREHEAAEEAVATLAAVVNETARKRGVLLIPSFAIGRTQEIVWELDRLLEARRIPELPLYLDSPMAKGASDIYRAHPEAYDEETARLLREHASPLDYPGQHVVQNVDESHRIARAKPPYIIVASNGMLTGGRSVGHAERLLGDPSATILFVGYQGEGTLGGHLVRGAETARIAGHAIKVRATVQSIDGFSAHADEPELLDWLGNFTRGRRPGDAGVPKTVFLVHGDPPAQEALAPKVRSLGVGVEVPAWLQTASLD